MFIVKLSLEDAPQRSYYQEAYIIGSDTIQYEKIGSKFILFSTSLPPALELAPSSSPRIVDSFGNPILGSIKVGQQIQITSDLTNSQDRDQPFAYLIQIQDQNGVTVSLSWITGTLSAGQSLNPAQSWTPSTTGAYNVQTFTWQGMNNTNPLSAPQVLQIIVR